MKGNLLHDDPASVADTLGWADDLTLADVTSALINALNRVAVLEEKLQVFEQVANRAANTASCIANGIMPD